MITGTILEPFSELFTTRHWPARWSCGYWSDFHGWMYIVSDLLIWLAYFCIPIIIVGYAIRKKQELRYIKTYILFASFIMLCGSTHLLDATMFWIPAYHFNTLIRAITALVSIFTVIHLIQILPQAFREKTSLVLEKEIAKRIEAEQKLRQANTDLETFAYMISHDLQEPLRKIQTFNGIAVDRLQTQPSSVAEVLEKSTHAAARLTSLITDILKLANLNKPLTLELVSLNEAVQHARNDLELTIVEHNAKLEVNDLPEIRGNLAGLSQVFFNLIGNAVKFNTNTPHIQITGTTSEQGVIVTVKDNGIGIDEEYLGKIFNPFYRLHGRKAYAGNGIGLSICKRVMDLHRGEISVKSTKESGTTFTLFFPHRPAEEVPEQ